MAVLRFVEQLSCSKNNCFLGSVSNQILLHNRRQLLKKHNEIAWYIHKKPTHASSFSAEGYKRQGQVNLAKQLLQSLDRFNTQWYRESKERLKLVIYEHPEKEQNKFAVSPP